MDEEIKVDAPIEEVKVEEVVEAPVEAPAPAEATPVAE